MPYAVRAYDAGIPYTQKFEYSGTNVIYIGWADPGALTSSSVWRIQKLTYSGDNVTDIQFADGSVYFDKVWDSRATYTYK